MENQACFVFSNKYRKEVDLVFGFGIAFVILVSGALKKLHAFCVTDF